MPYIIVDKTLRQVVEVSITKPEIDDANLLLVEVPSLKNIVVRHQEELPPPENVESYEIVRVWIDGTTFTQEQVDAEVARQANQAAKFEAAKQKAISTVNGTLVTSITAAQAITLVLLLAAEKDWIGSDGKILVK